MSDHLFQMLRNPLREYLSSDNEYDQIFDWFEYLLCLSHCDAQVTWTELAQKNAEKHDFTLWASVGRFNWKNRQEGELSIIAETEIREGEVLSEKVAAALRAGFFESADRSHRMGYGPRRLSLRGYRSGNRPGLATHARFVLTACFERRG